MRGCTEAWIRRAARPRCSSSLARLGELGAERVAAEAIDPVRELGCRRVRDDLLDRMGGTARRDASAARYGLSQRGQRRVGPPAVGGRRAGAQSAHHRERAGRARPGPADSLAAAFRDRAAAERTRWTRARPRRQSPGQRVGLRGLPQLPRNSRRGLVIRRAVRVYHSVYDTHHWVSRIGDPGFRYHVALVQLWGVLSMRLADSDVLPLDYEPYARRVAEFIAEVGTGSGLAAELGDARRAVAELAAAAGAFNMRRAIAIDGADSAAQSRMDLQLMQRSGACSIPTGWRAGPGIVTSSSHPGSPTRRTCCRRSPRAAARGPRQDTRCGGAAGQGAAARRDGARRGVRYSHRCASLQPVP